LSYKRIPPKPEVRTMPKFKNLLHKNQENS
jgi:hypothetical protein